MGAERPTKHEIFNAAVELVDDAERQAFLDNACGNDAQLREEIGNLLERDREAGSFLESPPAGLTITQPPLEKPGTQIGPYKLLRQIGEGGMGVVYMAEQREPVRRKVALKIIKPGMDTRQVIVRFEAERQALSLMDHPNIARVLDAGTTNSGRPYFVMELVEGQSITEYCDKHLLTPRQRLELLLPVCQAIQHAHQKGIIHRDIKPSNILVAQYDQHAVPKVIDFGVAKAISQPLTEKTMFTGFGQIVGTLEYMSPEQAKVNQLDIDTRSDIYSLGVLMYELLTGSTPFDRERLRSAAWDEMLRIIREEEPPKPSTKLSSSETLPSVSANRSMEPAHLSRTVRGELDWLVMKALEKDRSRRYETANGLAMDIERYLRNEPVQACPTSAIYQIKKFVRRNNRPVIAAAVLLLTLVGGIVGTTWGLVQAEQARRAEAERAVEERRAKEEAQKRLAQVEKGTEILASVFGDLDPIAAEKAGVSSRELLCRRLGEAAQQLEGEAVGDSLVVARLQHVLGGAMRELGHLEHATELLVKACRTRERLLGADHLDTVATKHELAQSYRRQENYPLAEVLFKNALAIRTAKLGADHLSTLATKHHLAWLYYNQQKYALAETLCNEVLAMRTAKLGADNLDTLATMHLLAVLYYSQEKVELAAALLREVVAGRTAKLGADYPDTLTSRYYLALLHHAQGEVDLAETLLREVVAGRTAKLGAADGDTLSAQSDLALLYLNQRKLGLAETAYKENLERRIAKFGPDDPRTLYAKYGLAMVYANLKKFDQAIPLLEETFKRGKANEHPATHWMQADLGIIYCGVGRFADAIEQLEGIHSKSRDDPNMASVGNVLLTAYMGAGKSAEAVALAAEQVQAVRERFPDDSSQLAAALAEYGKLLVDAKVYDAAEPLYQQALATNIAQVGPDHPETILSRDKLALLYWSMKKLDQSIPLLEMSLQQRKTQLDLNDPEILGRQVTLGANYCDSGRFADGIALIEEVRQKGRDDPHPAWVRSILLKAYIQAGNSTGATALVAERVRDVREEFPDESPELAAALADNAKLLVDAKAYADAEPLLLDAYQGLKRTEAQISNQENSWLQEAIVSLVQLYDAWGKPDEAAKWRKELEVARAASCPQKVESP